MNTNRWILSAIQDLREMARQNSLEGIAEALDGVYDVAEFELAASLEGTPSVSNTPLPSHPENVVWFPEGRVKQKRSH